MGKWDGTVWVLRGRPCRVKSSGTGGVWVAFLDGKQPELGHDSERGFLGLAKPAKGALGLVLKRLAELHLDDRVPFDQAKRDAWKAVV